MRGRPISAGRVEKRKRKTRPDAFAASRFFIKWRNGAVCGRCVLRRSTFQRRLCVCFCTSCQSPWFAKCWRSLGVHRHYSVAVLSFQSLCQVEIHGSLTWCSSNRHEGVRIWWNIYIASHMLSCPAKDDKYQILSAVSVVAFLYLWVLIPLNIHFNLTLDREEAVFSCLQKSFEYSCLRWTLLLCLDILIWAGVCNKLK